MSKKIIIGIIALIAILAVVAGTVILNNNNENNEITANNESTVLNEEVNGNEETTDKNNEENNKLVGTDKKILITYFSYSGNTEIAAKEIQNQVGGDLFEIKRKGNYSNVSEEAKDEIENNKRPELEEKLDSIEDYDIIFVGYPIWHHSTPAPVNTFLESYDLSGKTVIPFATSTGSDIEETLESFKSSCNSNKILEGITISGSSGNSNSGKDKIRNWLTGLSL